MRVRSCSLTVVIALWAVGFARTENWPQFRGPTGQGLAGRGNFPVEWSPTKNVAWKQTIPGHGWSSPVVQDGRVYLTTSVPVPDSRDRDHSLRALGLDVSTGEILWDVEVFRQDGK